MKMTCLPEMTQALPCSSCDALCCGQSFRHLHAAPPSSPPFCDRLLKLGSGPLEGGIEQSGATLNMARWINAFIDNSQPSECNKSELGRVQYQDISSDFI